MLTARELLQTKFSVVLRGYNPRQVDDFLRRVVGEYETLLQENATLRARLQVFGDGLVQAAATGEPETTSSENRADAQSPAGDAAAEIAALLAKKTEMQAQLANAAQQVADTRKNLCRLGQEAVDYHRRMRVLLQEYSQLLAQGEAEAIALHETANAGSTPDITATDVAAHRC